MKKLLTIIFALSLIMLYTLPAMAQPPIEVEDNNVNAAFVADNQANLDDSNGNMMDSTEIEDVEIEDNFQTNGNEVEDSFQANDNREDYNNDNSETETTIVAVDASDTDQSREIEDSNVQAGICDNNGIQDADDVASAEDNGTAIGGDQENENTNVSINSNEQEWENDQEWSNEQEDMNNNNNSDNREEYVEKNGSDNREYDTDVEIEDSFNYEDESKVATLSGNGAAAAFGGMAMAVDITEMRLNLAETTSLNFINQDSGDFEADADADADVDEVETDDKNGGAYGMANAGAAAGLMMQCTTVQNATYGNVGNTLVNVGAGNFNNQAGINSVTATIQY